MQNKIEDILKQVRFLKPTSGAVIKVLNVLNDPNTDAEEIKDAILLDPALTADVLRISNSAFFAFRQKITSIKHAVVLLGRKILKKIVFTVQMKGILNKKLKGYPQTEHTLWEHSLVAAVSAELIAEKLKYKNKELAYIGGLLHDIGKIILDQYVKNAFEEITKKLAEGMDLLNIEKEMFGYNHAEIGGIIAENWQLPLPIKESIAFHHYPTEATQEVIIALIVYLANNLATFISPVGFHSTPQVESQLLNEIGLNEADLEEIMVNVIAKKEDILAF